MWEADTMLLQPQVLPKNISKQLLSHLTGLCPQNPKTWLSELGAEIKGVIMHSHHLLYPWDREVINFTTVFKILHRHVSQWVIWGLLDSSSSFELEELSDWLPSSHQAKATTWQNIYFTSTWSALWYRVKNWKVIQQVTQHKRIGDAKQTVCVVIKTPWVVDNNPLSSRRKKKSLLVHFSLL